MEYAIMRLRMDKKLSDKLKKQAQENQRSLTQEINYRLIQSIKGEKK